MIRNSQIPNRAEKNGVKLLKLIEPTGRDVVAILQVRIAGPVKVGEVEGEIAVDFGNPLEHFNAS